MSEYLEFRADKFVFRAKKGLLYSCDEVWVSAEGDAVRVGITDYAQRRGSDIVFIEVGKPGTKVECRGAIGSYETVKMTTDILAPVGGVIREVNTALESKPETINSDPYGAGWIAVIEPSAKPEGLLTAEQYFDAMKEKVAEELRKIKGL